MAASSTFPRSWQLALIIGAPVVLSLTYLYYRRAAQEDDVGKKKKLGDFKAKTISLDGVEAIKKGAVDEPKTGVEVKRTPLEQAVYHKNEGNKEFKNGKYDAAIELYSLAIEACPKSETKDISTFYQNRAAAYEQLKKWDAVVADCTAALESNPRYVKALHRRARAYEQLKHLTDALEDITAACILERFQNSSGLAVADRVLKELGRKHAKEAMVDRPATTPSKHFVKTYFQSFTQDPIKKFAVVSSEPKGFIKAKMALDKYEFDKIIPACIEEIESSESEAEYKMEATLMRATFYLLTGRFADASVDLETVIGNQDATAKLKVNALIKRASLKMQTENPEGCFDDFTLAEKLDPENSDVYHHRGQVYTLLENMPEAIRDFEKAVKYAPNEGLLFVHKTYAEYRRALMEQNNAELNVIMEQFSIAIDKFPTCVECYSLMAQVLSDQQQYQAADSFFKKSIDLDPENATLYVHRGVLQLQWQGNIQTALSYIQNAIDVDDKCEFAYETLGTIEVQRANLEKAVDCFDKAINLAKSEMELVHLYSLKDAAMAQLNVAKKMGLDMSSLAAMAAMGMGSM